MAHFKFFSAIIELIRELVICNMHNKFGKDRLKTFWVIVPLINGYADANTADAKNQLQ